MLEVGLWGVIKGSFQKHPNRGWVKAEVVVGGGGFEGVTTPAPREIFNYTLSPIVLSFYKLLLHSCELS